MIVALFVIINLAIFAILKVILNPDEVCNESDYVEKFGELDGIIQDGIDSKIFPGAAALIGSSDGEIYYEKYMGYQTYDEILSIDSQIQWDLASVTKVLATTTAIMQFYERGELDLDTRIGSIFPEFDQFGKESVTVRNLLLHNSGLLPDPIPGFWEREYGCDESQKEHPKLSPDCQSWIRVGLMSQNLTQEVGEKYVYSDLSMITLHYVIGKLSKDLGYIKVEDIHDTRICHDEDPSLPYQETCFYESYIQKYVIEPLSLENTRFVVSSSDLLVHNTPPAWVDNDYRHELIHGYVSDPNSYAFGGVAGHAGLFSTPRDIFKILRDLMSPNKEESVLVEDHSIVEEFTRFQNSPTVNKNTRALGWDTNETPGSCGGLSSKTYMHTGYTGTLVCNDPERQLIVILLTNRCFPDDLNKGEIYQKRKEFTTRVAEIYDEFVVKKNNDEDHR